jgi:hypothetical protein
MIGQQLPRNVLAGALCSIELVLEALATLAQSLNFRLFQLQVNEPCDKAIFGNSKGLSQSVSHHSPNVNALTAHPMLGG